MFLLFSMIFVNARCIFTCICYSCSAVVRQSIINPNFDFNKIGIGGLDTEFNAIFRRAFASRVFPPEIAELMGSCFIYSMFHRMTNLRTVIKIFILGIFTGYKHVKGILLYGPPGTGKTLMARQIGKMLNAREPKIVNGPQILDKYVGESEANIRRLFADAEEEEKRVSIEVEFTDIAPVIVYYRYFYSLLGRTE